ncbi:MAG: M36 family metallopeptidase [Flavobacteriaceae bacterium]|nr:M36 family metallopeptidase [Flavobacteriaceae bacterium]
MKKLTFCLAFGLISTFVFQLKAQNFNSNIVYQLEQQLEQNQLKTSDVQYRVTSDHLSSTSNIHHTYFTQTINGIEVYGTESSIHVLSNGKTLSSSIVFVKNSVEKSAGISSPSISASQAVSSVANQLNYLVSENISVIENAKGTNRKTLLSDGGISLSPIPARLVYHISDDNQLVLAWDISIQEKSQQNWWSIRVDANSGQILNKNNWMVSCSFDHDHSIHEVLDYNKNLFDIPNYNEILEEASVCSDCYEVLAMPLESPYYGSRTATVNPANTTASPFGWHDTDGVVGAEFTDTRGNNVDAIDAGDNFGYRPDGGATLDFTGYPFDQMYTNANQYEDASITNLFYWNNIIHDVLYIYGMDEAGGNFQVNNYGNGGLGNDSVEANSQIDQFCNATFGTPPDGSSPSMNMFICGAQDGCFDNLVVIHEYGHGISNRLTGGPGNTGCLGNSEQMGEGWSDWYGVMMTYESGDTGTDARGVGTYLFNQGLGGNGIRPFPYSTDLGVNPQTYDDIKTSTVPHGVGSVWATMLWELTWALVDEHGFDSDIYNFSGSTNLDAGNIAALALVTEALKLQPCSPGFVDGRDAILAADQAIYGGANECIIWDAFAKRGLGVSANQGSSNSVSDGTEAFDTPSGLAAFIAPVDVCENEPELTGLGGGSPSGGVYSGTGVTDDGNGATYSFNPAVAGVGIHIISYEVQAGTCSVASTATDTIEVLAIPPGPTTTGAADFCVGDEVTVTATLADPLNVIRWYDAQIGGNFLFEGESYTFTPTGSIDVYAQEVPPGPISQLVISEITLETPDRLEIQNVGEAFDYTGYSVAVSKEPYPDVNAINSIVQPLGNMGANSVVDYNDDSGAGYWGNNIWWDNDGTGWIIIIDDNGNVVDSVFWNFTSAEIAGLNVIINGFNITAADLDWTGDGAALTIDCNNSFRRNGDTNSASDWSGICETSDYGVANSDINLGVLGCLGDRTVAEVIADQLAPTIACEQDIQISTDTNSCTATGVSLIDPTVTDNCAVQSLTNDAPASFPLGDTNVIWTVTDSAGNTNTCTQIVTVVDDVAPEVTCPADSVETINEGDLYTIPDFTITVSATDNCTASPLITQEPIVGTEIGEGDTTITITVTDDAGNVTICTFIITVEFSLSTTDVDYNSAIVLYPNPTNGDVTLLNNSNILIKTVTIFDINGRVINEISINGSNLESNFSIENQATGLYFVKIVSNDFSIIKKIVKK